MTGKALVVNTSAPHYNLGAAKLSNWLASEGWEVTRSEPRTQTERGEMTSGFGFGLEGFDLVCLSVIFSWHAPFARDIALRVKGSAEVWCGGPGVRALETWWRKETGLGCTRGLDQRFERQPGDYRMTFASRGCDQGCWFCIVPVLEGSTYTLDWDFKPAPVLCDNNLAGLPAKFQRFVVNRYRQSGVRLLDANSGFAPRQFTRRQYKLWKQIVRTWRFALDETKELADARRMLAILHAEAPARKRVYVLTGNEPVEACRERAEFVISKKAEPFCQPFLTLNMLEDPRDPETRLPERFDWTTGRLRDFARFYNRWIWRSVKLWEYKPRKGEPPPFAHLTPKVVVDMGRAA